MRVCRSTRLLGFDQSTQRCYSRQRPQGCAPNFIAGFEPLASTSDSVPYGRRVFQVGFGAASMTIPSRIQMQPKQNSTKRLTPHRNRGVSRAKAPDSLQRKAKKAILSRSSWSVGMRLVSCLEDSLLDEFYTVPPKTILKTKRCRNLVKNSWPWHTPTIAAKPEQYQLAVGLQLKSAVDNVRSDYNVPPAL